MTRQSKTKPIDAAKLLAEIQAKNPQPSVTVDELMRKHQRGSRSRFRRDPFALIQQFVSCFHFKEGRATLAFRPDDSIIELLAERFREYINGKDSLDSTFALKKSGMRGRRTAREVERLLTQEFGAKMLYEWLTENGASKDQAISKIATSYCCSTSKIHSLLFRDRSKMPTPKK